MRKRFPNPTFPLDFTPCKRQTKTTLSYLHRGFLWSQFSRDNDVHNQNFIIQFK